MIEDGGEAGANVPDYSANTFKTDLLEPTRKVRFIPGELGGHAVSAVADTGSSINAISLHYALLKGFVVHSITKSQAPIVKTLTGETIYPAGIVYAPWKFSHERYRPTNLAFWVIEDTPCSVYLGTPFLHASKVYGEMSHRLRTVLIDTEVSSDRRPIRALSQSNGEDYLPKFHGDMEGAQVTALADSGCDVNILNWQRAISCGLPLDTSETISLQLADGTMVTTCGTTEAFWRFVKAGTFTSNRPSEKTHYRLKFHVLRHCEYDIVLGQNIIYGIGKGKMDFSNIKCHSSDTKTAILETPHHYMSYVREGVWAGLKRRAKRFFRGNATTDNADDLLAPSGQDIQGRVQDAELGRRIQASCAIQKLDDAAAKEAARRREMLAQEQWNALMQASTATSTATRSISNRSIPQSATTTPSISNPSLSNPNRSIRNI